MEKMHLEGDPKDTGKPRKHKYVEIEYTKDHKDGYYAKGQKASVGVNHADQVIKAGIAKKVK